MAEKTERASFKKLLDARKRGRVAQSADLRAALAFALVVLAVVWLLGFAWFDGRGAVVWLLRQAVLAPHTLNTYSLLELSTGFWLLLGLLLSLLGGLCAHLVWLVQTGGVASFTLVAPDMDRVNPVTGFKRIFGLRCVTTALTVLFKTGLMVWIAVVVAHRLLYLSPNYLALPLEGMRTHAIVLMTDPAVRLLAWVAAMVVGLGLLDQGMQYFLFQRDMRQDKEELRRDIKEMEGDPLFKFQRRALALHDLLMPLPQAVEQASVMVTNPTHLAVLLRYAPDGDAPVPRVIYKAQGDAVRHMRRLAEQRGLAVLQWAPLARQLYAQVPLGDPVPVSLFNAVAQVLLWAEELKSGP